MTYLNCGRCGLEIKVHADYLQIANCPRCLARNATVAPLTPSPKRVVVASGWGPRAADPADPPKADGHDI